MTGVPLAQAGIRLPSIFGDNMVLQCERRLPVWGWAAPGSRITVTLDGQTRRATAGPDGRWRVTFPPHRAGGPVEMTVSGDGEVRLRNILFGEVWVCSGQSNMEMALQFANDAPAEMRAANYPSIRLFTGAKTVARTPQADLSGQWVPCSPTSAGPFSAVAYFFGRKLFEELGVPIGLIHVSWGGTVCEAWTPLEALASESVLEPLYRAALAELGRKTKTPEEYQQELLAWEQQAYHLDPGIAEHARGWAAPEVPPAGWAKAPVPGCWEGTLNLDIDGAVWFRKEFEIPEAWAGREIILHLGPIDDFDITFFNGREVGRTGRETPLWYAAPRRYVVPAELVKPGRAVVAVRIFDHFGQGGFTATDPAALHVEGPPGAAPATLPLAGKWQYRVELALPPKSPPPPPLAPDDPNMPTGLYNGMIHPLVPYAIRGAIWYQGESNASRAKEYRTLFPTMIRAWRRAWGQGSFPFYFVQLANYMARAAEPSESEWAELREAQALALKLPETGMAVAIDIGDAVDIHPRNKQEVGRRLALQALAGTYGRKLPASGPVFAGMRVKQGRAYLSFRHTHGGLRLDPQQLAGAFAVAGPDRRFVWAEAAVVGRRVVVWSPAVPEPVAVRYAWGSNPPAPLTNGTGLPASPFRTDDWERPGLH